MIRLVPNTGIHFVALSAVQVERLKRHDFRLRRGDRFSKVLPYLTAAQADVDFDDVDAAATGFRTRTAELSILSKLLDYGDAWVPIPYDGGSFWVCAWLHWDATANQVQMTLAVDTALEQDGNPDGLDADTQLGERAPSPCSVRFWRNRAVESHVRHLAARLAESGESANAAERRVESLQVAIAGLADHLARRPAGEARIYLEARPEATADVVVDLMLDLGNSRTCALLEERMADGRRQRLELAYPDRPNHRDPSPFTTQSAFFEKEIVPRSLDSTVSFRFLSVLKIGTGAVDALKGRDQDPRPLGLSTPKRYLWEDAGKVDWNWGFSNRLDAQGMSPPIDGDLVRRMDPGAIFAGPGLLPDVVRPDHPRAATMVWVIVELLEQAFRQINSPEWRRAAQNAPRSDRRRMIGNLVLTFPAGLHSSELSNFQKAARLACELWSGFRSSPVDFCDGGSVVVDPVRGVPAPRVQMVCDEAMAIQLCWLYGESVHRFAAEPQRLVEALGRKRRHGGAGDEAKDEWTLRVASMDIGGGTLDLSIADYRVIPGLPATVGFTCTRHFHDSISRAGDDIVRGILEDHVFPAVMEQIGCTPAEWNRLFSSAVGASDAVREYRRKLVRELWMPAAQRCLEALDASQDGTAEVRLGAVSNESWPYDSFPEMLRGPGAAKFKTPIRDVVVKLSRMKMRAVVRNTIGRTLDQCADIVDQFDCDLLIVGGRPSSNQEVREQIYASMAVPPGQVVFLSELDVSDWYPFADGNGRIGDAKTACAVGGGVAFSGRYANGAFRVDFVATQEPPAVVGHLHDLAPGTTPSFPRDNEIRFGGDGNRVSFMPMQPLVIACRRVTNDDAEARPIYQVRLRESLREDLLRNPGLQQPVSVRFDLQPLPERPEAELGSVIPLPSVRDRIKLRDHVGEVPRRAASGGWQALDAERALEMRPCSLLDAEGYWIDTGVFRRQDGARQ